MKPTAKAVQACAAWLVICLRIGWKKSDLDFLESLWWKYHDFAGRLTNHTTSENGEDRTPVTDAQCVVMAIR